MQVLADSRFHVAGRFPLSRCRQIPAFMLPADSRFHGNDARPREIKGKRAARHASWLPIANSLVAAPLFSFTSLSASFPRKWESACQPRRRHSHASGNLPACRATVIPIRQLADVAWDLELLCTRRLSKKAFKMIIFVKKITYMPKLYEYFGLIFLFYSNEHEPIHVHGKFQDKESKAEIVEIVPEKITRKV